ncbi:methyltransferase domain-containing protein [Agrococcus casei]|uniref:methyltransferase domain-containing protein n=1 Tax=Agrococcus casei TaxID=343512 RepID=UPI003F8F1C12
MITHEDLTWWIELAPTLDWTFATRYAEGAPHEYVVSGRTAGMTKPDYMRAASVIRTFGQPAKFYKSTNIYLTSPDGQHKWWGMDRAVENSTIINRCRPWHEYGAQNAPRTASEVTTDYDAVATEWDALHSATQEERDVYVSVIRDLLGERPRRILDIGCGTGLSLDIGLSDAVHFTGADPSRAMLNELVLKHPHTAALHPMRFETALERHAFDGTKFDAVIALGGSGSCLSPAETRALPALTNGPIVLTHASSPDALPASETDATQLRQSAAAAEQLLRQSAGHQLQAGRFTLTVSMPTARR